MRRAFTVTTPDGLTIAAEEAGSPEGREIVFIHGISQAAASWRRQLDDPALAAEFRMVAYDFRGHGASDKPLAAEAYGPDRLWADELAAVIATAGMRRPVLVGWSYGGRVISDYLRFHGDGGVAGVNYVAAVTRTGGGVGGPGLKHLPGMVSEDQATNLAATRAFLEACFEIAPEPDDFAAMLAFNMAAPPKVRAALLDRPTSDGDMLKQLSVPVLVTHGAKDQIILASLSEFTASTGPGARLSVYDDVGHAPFWEDAPRFNRELAAFVRGT